MADSFLGWWCIWARWHRWRFVRQLSKQTTLHECTHCGRQWATNHNVRITLPYHCVAEHYKLIEHI